MLAKTRDSLVKMTEETSIAIPDDVCAAFMALDDDYLADVLRLWDCDLRDWRDPVATIFRFENNDIIVWRAGETIKCQIGAVDTTTARSCFSESADAGVDRDACICWISDANYSRFIGVPGNARELLKRFAGSVSKTREGF